MPQNMSLLNYFRFRKIYSHIIKYEASYFDRINMTENQLEYDQKIITLTNMNNGT